jgi:hypothetical protein
MQSALAARRHAKFAESAQSFVKSEEALILDNACGSRKFSGGVDKTSSAIRENAARIRGEIRQGVGRHIR